jgi:hypothetical protein
MRSARISTVAASTRLPERVAPSGDVDAGWACDDDHHTIAAINPIATRPRLRVGRVAHLANTVFNIGIILHSYAMIFETLYAFRLRVAKR